MGNCDAVLRAVFEAIAKAKAIDVAAVPSYLLNHDWDELNDRKVVLQPLHDYLLRDHYDSAVLKKQMLGSFLLKGMAMGVSLNEFFKDKASLNQLEGLLTDRSKPPSRDKVDAFITYVTASSFHDKKGIPKGADAALFASVLLTALYPADFVDYRQGRWRWMAQYFGLDREQPDNYADAVFWAANNARLLTETRTFKDAFASVDIEPMWIAAGLCALLAKEEELRRIVEDVGKLDTTSDEEESMQSEPKNVILYGPPGTGKTYQTIRRAVALIDGDTPADDETAKKRFDQLLDQSRIGFVTFHQSYSYEDFVEGIRPVMDDEGAVGTPRYECRDGIFKRMCALARSDARGPGAVGDVDWKSLRVWKMSLGNTLDPEDVHIFDDCIKGGFIAHGAGRGLDFTKAKNVADIRKSLENEDWTSRESTLRHHISQVHALRNDMREGDVVVVSFGNHYFRAIGRVAGEYGFNAAYEYPQTRPVKWLRVFDEPQPKERLLRGKAFSQLTLYPLSASDLKIDALRELLSAQGTANPGKYVLIIDEINRGNISKILGELITLIESDKRQGQPYALTVTLPYSQQPFSVPDNLYILGTMNTADKSIALVDVALRRRFHFQELMPDFVDGNVCSRLTAEMRDVLLKLNQRIVVRKDRDHQIGHAYFITVCDEPGFNRIFAGQIIPLLQEYFYNDWEGLRYVLGEEGTAKGAFITAIADGDRKWARNRWQWDAEIRKVSILKQLVKNYSAGLSIDDQVGQAAN